MSFTLKEWTLWRISKDVNILKSTIEANNTFYTTQNQKEIEQTTIDVIVITCIQFQHKDLNSPNLVEKFNHMRNP